MTCTTSRDHDMMIASCARITLPVHMHFSLHVQFHDMLVVPSHDHDHDHVHVLLLLLLQDLSVIVI